MSENIIKYALCGMTYDEVGGYRSLEKRSISMENVRIIESGRQGHSEYFLYFCPGIAMLKCRVLKSESMTHADACTVFMTAGWHQKIILC